MQLTQARVRRAAVVGADGFIGRRLAAALHTSGVPTTGYTRQRELFWRDAATAGADRPDVVFYLASSITPALAARHHDRILADHRRFAALLADLTRSPQPPTVVLASSGGTVYAPDLTPPYREDAPTRATSPYGAAKLALERLLLDRADAVPAVVLRLSNVYGPGQRTGKSQGVLAYWLRAAAAGQPLPLIGDPDAVRDYVYVDDVVDCMCRVAVRTPARADPLVLNVGSGRGTSLRALLSTVERVVGRELRVDRMPARAVDRFAVWLDVERAARVLDWRPRTALIDGVAAMWRAAGPRLEPAPASW
jgi:UDP-glucose 4-epimerase